MTTNTPAGAEMAGMFRKKPVVIEASQWHKNGDHPLDYSKDHDGLEGGELRVFTAAERRANAWEGDIVRYYRHPDVSGETPCKHCGVRMHEHGWIDTLEGGHIVCPGDWVVTGVKGEHYPCKPDIFAATYEPAASLSPASVGAEGMVNRSTVIEWLDALDIEVTDRQLEGLFHAASTPSPAAPAGGGGEADADEDYYVIQQLGRLLAEIAVVIKGPERARHRHGYADLPALVMELMAFKQAVLDPENQPSQFGTVLAVGEDQSLNNCIHHGVGGLGVQVAAGDGAATVCGHDVNGTFPQAAASGLAGVGVVGGVSATDDLVEHAGILGVAGASVKPAAGGEASKDALTPAEALAEIDARLRACFGEPISAEEAYDSFYQEMVAEALAAARAAQQGAEHGK